MDSSPLLRPWRKFRQLSWRERRWLAQAWCGMPMIQWRLNRIGFNHVRATLETPVASSCDLHDDDARKLAELVRVAARRHVMKLECLPQSLWLWNRLRRLGFPCDLKLGVAQAGPPAFQAHAWVELNGQSLDAPSTQATRPCAPFTAIAQSEAS